MRKPTSLGPGKVLARIDWTPHDFAARLNGGDASMMEPSRQRPFRSPFSRPVQHPHRFHSSAAKSPRTTCVRRWLEYCSTRCGRQVWQRRSSRRPSKTMIGPVNEGARSIMCNRPYTAGKLLRNKEVTPPRTLVGGVVKIASLAEADGAVRAGKSRTRTRRCGGAKPWARDPCLDRLRRRMSHGLERLAGRAGATSTTRFNQFDRIGVPRV